MAFHVPNKLRLRTGPMGSTEADENNGVFLIANHKIPLRVLASDGMGWEHVSVSLAHRCPTWPEMCHVKSLFWDPSDCVMQLHPPQADYVNNHSYCLHLWRPVGGGLARPPGYLVGVKELGTLK